MEQLVVPYRTECANEDEITIEWLLMCLVKEDLITIHDLKERPLEAGAGISAMLRCYFGIDLHSKIVIAQEDL